MENLDKRYIEITVNEYKELLEKEVRLGIIIQKLKADNYVSKDTLLGLAGETKIEEKEEEE